MSEAGESQGPVSAGDIAWRGSSRCVNAGCVEVAVMGNQVLVRDSKVPDGPVLSFNASEWQAFVAGVKDAEFDL